MVVISYLCHKASVLDGFVVPSQALVGMEQAGQLLLDQLALLWAWMMWIF